MRGSNESKERERERERRSNERERERERERRSNRFSDLVAACGLIFFKTFPSCALHVSPMRSSTFRECL